MRERCAGLLVCRIASFSRVFTSKLGAFICILRVVVTGGYQALDRRPRDREAAFMMDMVKSRSVLRPAKIVETVP